MTDILTQEAENRIAESSRSIWTTQQNPVPGVKRILQSGSYPAAEVHLVSVSSLDILAAREATVPSCVVGRISENSVTFLKDLLFISTFPLLCAFEPSVLKKNVQIMGKKSIKVLYIFFPIKFQELLASVFFKHSITLKIACIL